MSRDFKKEKNFVKETEKSASGYCCFSRQDSSLNKICEDGIREENGEADSEMPPLRGADKIWQDRQALLLRRVPEQPLQRPGEGRAFVPAPRAVAAFIQL